MATITNIISEADRIKVFVEYGNGQTEVFAFGLADTKDTILEVVRAKEEVFTDLENKAKDLAKELVGKEV